MKKKIEFKIPVFGFEHVKEWTLISDSEIDFLFTLAGIDGDGQTYTFYLIHSEAIDENKDNVHPDHYFLINSLSNPKKITINTKAPIVIEGNIGSQFISTTGDFIRSIGL